MGNYPKNKETKYYNKQIMKVSGNKKFFEVMNNSFGIDKVQINFFGFDSTKASGSKYTDEINIFINFSDMYVLCQDVLSGRISGLIESSKKAGQLYTPAFKDDGGVTAENLKFRKDRQGKSMARADGMALSRSFKIIPSTKDGFVAFQAESGAGDSTKSETGGIVPAYGTKPDHRVMIPISYSQLKAFALMVTKHMDFYLQHQYATDAYVQEREENKEETAK